MSDLQQMQILIVDDQPANLELLARVLRERGYKLRAVSSGERALEAAQLSPPDCVLLDVSMPGLDGYEVCRRFQADETLSAIPIIFLTAHDDAGHKVRGFEVGGRDYISKPFEAEEVVARVQNQLQIKLLENRLKRQKEAVEEANAKLQAAIELKSRISATLVHDIRNPLMVMGAILDREIDAEVLADARVAYERIDKLLTELLELAKAEFLAEQGRQGSVDVGELIERVVRLSQHIAQTRGITLTARAAPRLPHVDGDAGQLERVFSNLIGNALKFTPSGGSVRVSSELDHGDGVESGLSFLRVSVADTGPGIPPAELPFVFDSYRQAAGAESKGGFGLGLAIAARIVARHGGRIRVLSQLGVGTEFYVLLPIPEPR